MRARHFAYILAIVESRLIAETTPVEPTWSHPIGAELGNIDAARSWALDRDDAEGAMRMAVALGAFWDYTMPTTSARLSRIERALGLPGEPTTESSVRARAEALDQAGQMEYWFRNRERAVAGSVRRGRGCSPASGIRREPPAVCAATAMS